MLRGVPHRGTNAVGFFEEVIRRQQPGLSSCVFHRVEQPRDRGYGSEGGEETLTPPQHVVRTRYDANPTY